MLQVNVPWADPGSGLTALMEPLIIDWLREESTSAASRRMRRTWHEIEGVKQRAVHRGLARHELEAIARIGVDKTSFQKRHEYVMVLRYTLSLDTQLELV